MCLIVVAHNAHPRLPLVVAANRDESFTRPTDRADFWEDHRELLAGRDQKAGGTWLGLTRGGRFGAVTNFRDPAQFHREALSRGELLRDCLVDRGDPAAFFESRLASIHDYNGYNMIVGDLRGDHTGMVYHTNSDRSRPEGRTERLAPGIFALSNELLESPWPKQARVRDGLRAGLGRHGDDGDPGALIDALFDLMADQEQFPDADLPDTGIGLEFERLLSSVFIPGDRYGTRSTTVLAVTREGNVHFQELAWGPRGERGELRTFEFSLET